MSVVMNRIIVMMRTQIVVIVTMMMVAVVRRVVMRVFGTRVRKVMTGDHIVVVKCGNAELHHHRNDGGETQKIRGA